MTGSGTRLTREETLEALGLAPETVERVHAAGALVPGPDGLFDPLAVAGAAARYGEARAEAADRRLAAVAAAISDVRPALERLAGLAGHAGLEGDAHDRAMKEVAAFFTAFAQAMTRATAALQEDE